VKEEYHRRNLDTSRCLMDLKTNLQKKVLSVGSWITLGHLSIVEIMADAGFDWLCVDLEHSVVDYYQTELLISAIQAKGLFPFVRVGENNSRIIKRVMDAGALGIIVPRVNSGEDALNAVQAVKYPPLGARGVGLARAQGYGFNFEEYARKINNESVVIVQIEHRDAVENIKEILSVEGVDGCIIGPYDLSGSMGKPGQYDDPLVLEALEKVERITKELNKPLGFHVIQPDYELAIEKIQKGYTFIAFSLDILFLGTICRDQMKLLKANIS